MQHQENINFEKKFESHNPTTRPSFVTKFLQLVKAIFSQAVDSWC